MIQERPPASMLLEQPVFCASFQCSAAAAAAAVAVAVVPVPVAFPVPVASMWFTA